MSTKTTYKRIALVAVASLGFGLLAAVPTQAGIIGTPTVTASNGTSTNSKSDSTTAASIAVSFFTQNSNDSAVITLAAGSKPDGTFDSTMIRFGAVDTTSGTIQTTLGFRTVASDTITTTTFGFVNSRYNADSSVTVANPTINDANNPMYKPIIRSTGLATYCGKFAIYIDSCTTTTPRATAGDFTIPYTVEFYSDGVLNSAKSVAGTLTITNSISGVAAAGTVTAAATSSAILYGGSSFVVGNTVDSATLSLINTPDTTVDAVIRLTQLTAAGAPSRESITVTIDKGNIGTGGSALGKSLVLKASTNGVDDIQIFGDGTSGLATITLKTTSVTFSNKTVTWYSDKIASITVTKLGNTLGSSSANVLLAVAKDATGNVSQQAVYAVAADRTIIATTVTTGTTCSYVAAYGGNVCSLAGATDGTTTITVWDKSDSSRTVSSTAVSLTVSTKSPVAIKLATDKTTYAPGEIAYVRVWAVDSAGNPVAPGTYTNLLASGGVSSTASMGNGSDTTTAVSFTTAFTTSADGYASAEGIKLYKVYMPATGGEITFSATGGSLLPATGQVAVTTKVTVTDNASSALAAVTALASQVSAFITKINAQITTLTDLVMKIQKKVKA